MAAAPDDVALLSVQWGNSEVGTVQPVAECAEVAHAFGVPIHTDAVQAAAWLDVDFDQVGVDAMSVSGHKVGGPHGVGALLLSRGVSVVPVLHGGGQERDVRSGTLDVPAIAAFASALVEMSGDREERVARVARLREALVDVVMAAVPDAQLNGPGSGPVGRRLPGHAHFSFPGCHGDSLLLLLDARDIYCSTGSACSAGVAQPSHVLLAMGHDPEIARSSLRFSLGHTSSEADVEALADVIGSVVQRARAAGPT
jgi:cysteine desulfurase